MARVFDLFGEFDDYNSSPSGAIADALAIRSDWVVVGQDLQQAIEVEAAMINGPQLSLFEDLGEEAAGRP